MKMTKFENKLKDAIEKGDFEIVDLPKKERDKYREAAKAALAKDKVVTLRLNGQDLKALKEIALKSGKKYQTYIGELLHEHILRRSKAA